MLALKQCPLFGRLLTEYSLGRLFHSRLVRKKPRKTSKCSTRSDNANKELLHLLNLQRKGVSSIDSYKLFAVLKSFNKASLFSEAKQVHTLIISLGMMSLFLQAALIGVYSAMGDIQSAHRLFDEITNRNVVCWTALISAYVNNHKPNKAVELFSQMQMENVEPDEVTLTTVLSACADLGALETGEWIHAYIFRKRNFVLDICLNNALLNMYAKCGDIETSRKLFNSIKDKDVTTWTTMIVGYALHGQAEEALNIFKKMLGNDKKRIGYAENLIIPNEITFIGVLMACSHKGLVEEGWKYLQSMDKEFGLKPQMSHYGCMVDIFCRSGLVNEAYEFIKNMPMEPNAVIWRTLLGACSIHGKVEHMDYARRRLLDLQPNYVGDVVAMSNVYASLELWDKKINMRKGIKQRRTPGYSSIEIDGTVHVFLASDKKHPMRKEIFKVLESMSHKLRI